MRSARRVKLRGTAGWTLVFLLVPATVFAGQYVNYLERDSGDYWRDFYIDRELDEVYHQVPFYSGFVELRQIASGDLNNDGVVDFVASDLYGQHVMVLLGLGANQGYSRGVVVLDTKAVASVQLSDLDLDDNQDLIVTGRLAGSEDVAILYGDGQGGFTRLLRLEAHTAPMATFTFKRLTDRRPWLCCVNYGSRDIDLYAPKGRRDLERRERFNFGPYPNAVIQSVDAKSSMTTLTALSAGDRSIWQVQLKPKGTPILVREDTFDVSNNPRTLALLRDTAEKSDADGAQPPPVESGVPLVGIGGAKVDKSWGGFVRTFRPSVPGEFRGGRAAAVRKERVPIRMVSGDFLGDGKTEFVVVYARPDRLYAKSEGYWRSIDDTEWYLFQEQPDGSWQAIAESTGWEIPTNLIVADMDGNGLKDLVYGYYPHGNLLVWRPLVRTPDGYGMLPALMFPFNGVERVRIDADRVGIAGQRPGPYNDFFRRFHGANRRTQSRVR